MRLGSCRRSCIAAPQYEMSLRARRAHRRLRRRQYRPARPQLGERNLLPSTIHQAAMLIRERRAQRDDRSITSHTASLTAPSACGQPEIVRDSSSIAPDLLPFRVVEVNAVERSHRPGAGPSQRITGVIAFEVSTMRSSALAGRCCADRDWQCVSTVPAPALRRDLTFDSNVRVAVLY